MTLESGGANLGTKVNTYSVSGGGPLSGISFSPGPHNGFAASVIYNGSLSGSQINGTFAFHRIDTGGLASFSFIWSAGVPQSLAHQ